MEEVKKWKEDEKYFPFPHKFNYTHSVVQFINEYEQKEIEKGTQIEGEYVRVVGRINVVRKASGKLHFIDIKGEGKKL